MTGNETAIISGLIGVVGGSLASGAVQSDTQNRQWREERVSAKRDRALRSRVAAQVLYADIDLAWRQLDRVSSERPVPDDVDVGRYRANWSAQREALAAVVCHGEFQAVAGAFAELDAYCHYLLKDDPHDPARAHDAAAALAKARPVVWKAGGGDPGTLDRGEIPDPPAGADTP